MGCSWWGRVRCSGIWPKIKLLEKISDSESRRHQSLQRVYLNQFHLHSFCHHFVSFLHHWMFFSISCNFAIFTVIVSFVVLVVCCVSWKLFLHLCVSAALSSLYIFFVYFVIVVALCLFVVLFLLVLDHFQFKSCCSLCLFFFSGESRVHSLKLLLSLHLYGYFCHFALQTTTNTTRQ